MCPVTREFVCSSLPLLLPESPAHLVSHVAFKFEDEHSTCSFARLNDQPSCSPVATQPRADRPTYTIAQHLAEEPGPLDHRATSNTFHRNDSKDLRRHGRRRRGSAAVNPATHRRSKAIPGWPVSPNTQTKWPRRKGETATSATAKTWCSHKANWVCTYCVDKQPAAGRPWRSRE